MIWKEMTPKTLRQQQRNVCITEPTQDTSIPFTPTVNLNPTYTKLTVLSPKRPPKSPTGLLRSTPITTANNFYLYMNVSDKNPEAFVFTKLNVLHTILDAFQDADPSTVLVNPPSSMHQEYTFTCIAPNDTINHHIYDNLEQQLHNTTSGHICGMFLFNSSTSYSIIKKHSLTRKKLQYKFKYKLIIHLK
jgi:hypothetical protein